MPARSPRRLFVAAALPVADFPVTTSGAASPTHGHQGDDEQRRDQDPAVVSRRMQPRRHTGR